MNKVAVYVNDHKGELINRMIYITEEWVDELHKVLDDFQDKVRSIPADNDVTTITNRDFGDENNESKERGSNA